MIEMKMIIKLKYDDKIMHGNDIDSIEWFYNDILLGKSGDLILHSNEIGDTIGDVEVLEILNN